MDEMDGALRAGERVWVVDPADGARRRDGTIWAGRTTRSRRWRVALDGGGIVDARLGAGDRGRTWGLAGNPATPPAVGRGATAPVGGTGKRAADSVLPGVRPEPAMPPSAPARWAARPAAHCPLTACTCSPLASAPPARPLAA